MRKEITDKRKLLILACGACLLVMNIAASAHAASHRGNIFYPPERAEDGVKTVIDGTGVTLTYHEQTENHEPGTGEILVNINTAYDYEMVKLLPGIGEKRAAAIVEYREMCGGFNSVEELLNVKGIGKGIYEKMCMYCTVEGPRVSSAEYSGEEWLHKEPDELLSERTEHNED